MKKLVRDKIPEFATYASYRQLKPDEREDALKNKIVEEANEVKAAPDDQNLLKQVVHMTTCFLFISICVYDKFLLEYLTIKLSIYRRNKVDSIYPEP